MTTFWSVILLFVIASVFYSIGHHFGKRSYNFELENSHTLMSIENEMLKHEVYELEDIIVNNLKEDLR